MLTITGAARILLDAATERDGDLVITGGRVTTSPGQRWIHPTAVPTPSTAPLGPGHGHRAQHHQLPDPRTPTRFGLRVDGAGGRLGDGELRDVEGGTAVRAVAPQEGRGDRKLEGSRRVEAYDVAGGDAEDAVGIDGGPDVDLDATEQTVDVRAQQDVRGVPGALSRGRDERAGRRCLACIPGVAGGSEESECACVVAVGER